MTAWGWGIGVPEKTGRRGVGVAVGGAIVAVADAVGVKEGNGMAVSVTVGGSGVAANEEGITVGVAAGAHATEENAIAAKRTNRQFCRHIGDGLCSF